MNVADPPFCIAALYRFTVFQDCSSIRLELAALCGSWGIKGILLIALEGINGTIAGSDEAVMAVLAHIKGLPGCATLDIKFSRSDVMPFHRMKIQVKPEIVTMGLPDIDPTAAAGHYVAPEDWNALISEPGTILIDTRNDYEVRIGSFAGAINPEISTFRDFPAWFDAERERLLETGIPPKVAMFCTGGIRCEKSTAFLRARGVDEVYHLQGGILKYLETVPAQQSLWEGECFVFDQRVAVGHGLAPGTHTSCYGCRRPLNADDRESPLFQEGVSCPACHGERTDIQRSAYAERHKQESLAKKRGDLHLGRNLSTSAS